MARFVLRSVSLALFAASAHGSAMRGGGPSVILGSKSAEELKTIMMEELVEALGGSRVATQRLGKIEAALQPIFSSMPKNEYGNLEHSAVRYALHRLFVQRHGMYIKGLEPSGDAWNSSSAVEVLEDRVPAFVQSLFEERLHGRGLGMHEMAALAATLEHLIHDEAVDRLMTSYKVHGHSLLDRLDLQQAEEVIDTYMVLFILGKNSSISMEDVLQERASIQSVYPSWPQSQAFAREVRQSVVQEHAADEAFAGNTFAFNGTERVVEEIGERYGRWQDAECQDLKSALLKMEAPGTGRVMLKDFYGNALGGAWQFTESVEYLRELGALDETNPQRMSVIIPNYINSPSNCLASSSLYSVCCLNECEALLGQVERQIAAPDAEPAALVKVVSQLPSATVQAPRQLSATLLARLDEVASHHGGRVPLHGRLFAQWLHHAYPRECPYPHKAGTTNPMTADEWMQEKGSESLTASPLEMQQHIEAQQTVVDTKPATDEVSAVAASAASTTAQAAPAGAASELNHEHSLMWTAEEELVVVRPFATPAAPAAARSGASSALRTSAMLAAGTAATYALLSAVRSAMSSLSSGPSKRGREELLPFTMKQHVC